MSRFFARIEAVCANAVERAFALAFPSALEPVQVARKLVAAFESGPGARGGRRFVVHVGAADYARLENELPYLERQWTTMLAGLVGRTGRPERPPLVAVLCDERAAGGTVTIEVELRAEPQRLALRVRTGVPAGGRVSLDRRVTVGRDAGCDVVLVDSRVSRHHIEIVPDGATLCLRDTGSTNGTLLNGKPVLAADLGLGDVLRVGDSELVIEPDT